MTAIGPPRVRVSLDFAVIDGSLLRRVYARYCVKFPDWAVTGLTDPTDIAEELVVNKDLVAQALAVQRVGWTDLGLER